MDASLLEINPMVITNDDKVIALDAKVTLDDNAFNRHRDYPELKDENEEDKLFWCFYIIMDRNRSDICFR